MKCPLNPRTEKADVRLIGLETSWHDGMFIINAS